MMIMPESEKVGFAGLTKSGNGLFLQIRRNRSHIFRLEELREVLDGKREYVWIYEYNDSTLSPEEYFKKRKEEQSKK